MDKTSTAELPDEVKGYIDRVHSGKLKTSLKDGDLEILKGKMLQSLELDLQQLVTTEVFISGLVLRMPIVPVRDCRVATACTDGTRIYFDIDFYTRLSQKERVFVIAHEVWHNALLHFMRRENREQDLWNIATDCEINYALKQERFTLPDGMCLPKQSDEGKCAEDIYDGLDKSSSKKSGGSRGAGQPGEAGGGKMDSQFDQHMDSGNIDSEYGEGFREGGFRSPTDKWGEKGFDEDFRPTLNPDAADKIREMVVSEMQRYERSKGSVPSFLQTMVGAICKPEISWEELLAQFVTTCLGDRRQWLPPLRRGVYNEMYFQSRRGQRINVACIVDTSGSTEGDLPKFLTEMTSLLETFGQYEMNVIQCDCEVKRIDNFDDSNPFPVDDPLSYSFEGGGGSSLIPAFDALAELDGEPSCVVVFTDGYIDCPPENPTGIPTLFVLTQDGSSGLCDWGTKIMFKSRR